jgi:hypothetical protein
MSNVLPFTPPEPPRPEAPARIYPRYGRKPTRAYPIAAMVRQWQVLKLIEGRGRTVHELTQALHVSRLLIARDLKVIERAGFPLYDEVDGAGAHRWRLATKSAGVRRSA